MKMNIRLRPDADVRAETIKIGKMSALVVRPKEPVPDAPGVLWIHGGGYITGLKEMVYMSRAIDLVKEFHAVGAHLYEGARGGAWNQQEPAHGRRGECRRRTYRRALHAREG